MPGYTASPVHWRRPKPCCCAIFAPCPHGIQHTHRQQDLAHRAPRTVILPALPGTCPGAPDEPPLSQPPSPWTLMCSLARVWRCGAEGSQHHGKISPNPSQQPKEFSQKAAWTQKGKICKWTLGIYLSLNSRCSSYTILDMPPPCFSLWLTANLAMNMEQTHYYKVFGIICHFCCVSCEFLPTMLWIY